MKRAHTRTPLFVALLCLAGCGGGSGGVDGGPDGTAGDSAGACTADEDCDDGLFCTGSAICLPDAPAADGRGCVVPAGGACLDGQTCSEEADRCFTDCDTTSDADGDDHDARECGGDDCNDADANAFPGNLEVCDTDDHDEDCDPTTFGFRDMDGDGSPDARCCNVDADGASMCGDDCDDAAPGRNPTTSEVCDTIDNDCDDMVDEMVGQLLYPDADDDGAGDASAEPVLACAASDGLVANASDCDDADPSRNAGAPETCDEVDNDCDDMVDEGLLMTLYPDLDHDGAGDASAEPVMACAVTVGLALMNNDCDDANEARNPGATEICDEIDNDCDEMVDEERVDVPWFVDADGDGYGDDSLATVLSCVPVEGRAIRGGDCNETNALDHPFAPERCDGVDNNCSTGGGADATEDMDGDMHSPPTAACADGYPKDDCDDGEASIYGGAPEPCNRIDNDCSSDGGVDPAEDADEDGHAPSGAVCSGGLPTDDCDDTRSDTYTGAPELCDELDNDCSTGGGADPAEDADMDGHSPTGVCSGGLPADDCDDSDAAVYGGAPETCNRLDEDCSAGGGAEVSEDADEDGFSPTGAMCTGGFARTDCDDTRAQDNPDAMEVCSGHDGDCDGTVDEQCLLDVRQDTSDTESLGKVRDPEFLPNGTIAATLTCPENSVATGVVFYDGSGGDGVQLQCTNIQVEAVAPEPFSFRVVHGAQSFETYGPTEGVRRELLCPTGTFLVGFRHSTSSDGIRCAALDVFGSRGAYSFGPTSATTVNLEPAENDFGMLTRTCSGSRFVHSLDLGFDISSLRTIWGYCTGVSQVLITP